MRHALIVGGGIAGLAAAYDLDRAGVDALVVERDAQLGGVIRTERREGCVIEGGPDSFIAQKPAALQLIREVGLEAEVIGSNDHQRVTYLRKRGRLIPLPDGLMMMIPTKLAPVARSPLLSWGTKIKMGLEYFRPAPAAALPDRSVADFVRDHYGQETVDYLAEPLLAGVYGGDPSELSAPSVLGRLVDLETKYGSLTKGALEARKKMPASSGSLFRTLKSGLGTLVDALRPRQAQLNAAVETVERDGAGWRARVNGDWIAARHLLLTGPAYGPQALLRAVAPSLSEALGTIGYSSSATVNLAFRQADLAAPLTGFGFLVPRVERARMRAATFVRNKFDHRVAPGWEVVRCFFGGTADPGAVEESDEALVEIAGAELHALMGITAKPAFFRISRWRRAMAQYPVGHTKTVAAIQEQLREWPGLHLAGNGYQGIGIPDCIEMGRAAAKQILGART
jgi:oxygen-dependent protoporphyrinogen oxidase